MILLLTESINIALSNSPCPIDSELSSDFLLVGKGQDEDPRPEVTQSLRNKSIIDTVSLIPGAPMWLNMALE